MTGLEFRRLIEEKGKLNAVRCIEPSCGDESQADAFIYAYGKKLILSGKAAMAGVLWLGERIFNPRPKVVGLVWNAIAARNMVLIQGSSSVAKSYTGIAWHFLRWHGDPENTTIKIISVTGSHAQTQIFDTLKMMQEKSCCKLPGVANSESLLIDPYNKRGGFTILKIKSGADNSGVLQGFHPLPRDKPHPVYGASTAVFAVIDEAEEVAGGVWTGVGNLAGSDDGSGNVKATAFYNPKDQSSKVASLAEPVGGWGEFNVETGVKGSDEWRSKDGWHVVRLDAKKTENVQQRKLVFPNFHTYEDYRRKEQKHNGNSPEYFTMCRGAYPPDSVVKTIFTQRIVAGMRGEFIFTAGTVTAFAGDIAVDGRDEAVATVGRIGLASAFKPTNGPIVRFKHDRRVLQVDQQMPVTKGSTKIVALAMRDSAKSFSVSPKYFMGDRTGNGGPVIDFLSMSEIWSEDVQGIDFSKPATNSKILDEDSEMAEDLYEGIHTEVWFAAARLAEFGYVAIGSGVRSEELERQILGRRYIQGAGKKLRCEKKEDYKSRLGRSPDHADSFTILVHLFRMNTKEFASMSENPRASKKTNLVKRIVDPVQWLPGGI